MATSAVTPTLDPVTAAQFAAFQEQQQAAVAAPEALAAIAAPSFDQPIDTWVDAVIVRFASKTVNGDSLSIAFRAADAPADYPEAWTCLSFNEHRIKNVKGGIGSRWAGSTNADKSLDILDYLGVDLTLFSDVPDEELAAALTDKYAGTPASVKFEYETYQGQDVLKVAHIQASDGNAVKPETFRRIAAKQAARKKSAAKA